MNNFDKNKSKIQKQNNRMPPALQAVMGGTSLPIPICICLHGGDCCEDIICIQDFSGNHNTPGFWADWCPVSKTVYFGGSWGGVPPLNCEQQPPGCDGFDIVSIYVKNWLDSNKE